MRTGGNSPSHIGFMNLTCHSFDKTAKLKSIEMKVPRFRLVFDEPLILNKSSKYKLKYDKETL